MVDFTITAAVRAAIEEHCRLVRAGSGVAAAGLSSERLEELSTAELGDHIEHSELISISQYLVKHAVVEQKDGIAKHWRLDTLMRGSTIYKAPPPPKPEPTAEYKALMSRLRKEEEQKQYERMINPLPPKESFGPRYTNASASFEPLLSHGRDDIAEIDEVTFQDINRQLTLIINILVTIIASSVTIWFAARYWSVPQRLALALLGSVVIAIAEVAVYMGYIRRIKDAKGIEAKKVERKELGETWVITKSTGQTTSTEQSNVRFRKGKHR